MLYKTSLLGVILLLCSGCGYRLGDPESVVSNYQTISVPAACGDRDGQLTNALVRRVSRAGMWRYVSCGGQLTLKTRVTSCSDENIDFQFERRRRGNSAEGELVERLLPNEGRMTLQLEVRVVEAHSGKTVVGPFCVKQETDYAFDPLSTDNRNAVFSLGQFVNIDEAQDAMHPLLYEQLAERVVDFLRCAVI